MGEPQPDLSEIEVRRGALRLALCPNLGGAITHLSYDGIDLLRPWDGSNSVRRTGCFVLAPFSNRVGGAAFEHAGHAYPLRRLSEDHPLPIHGVAWKRPWTLIEQNASRLTLRMAHRPDGDCVLDWPFAFDLEHRLELVDNGLDLHLSLENRDTRAMPAGLGWHPYFMRHDACDLQFAAQAVWQNDAEGLPSQLSGIPAPWDFSTAKPLHAPGLDNCFAGRSGPVSIRWPRLGIELSLQASEVLDHLVVFTPPAEMGFFAVEPVSHANNALCLDDPGAHGMRTLAPGQRLQASCAIRISRVE
ncbi:aldose 1-epimerase [Stutzerimonas stutzeri]|uniref:aldose 1-epimerase n=1 Tax=Stutzerimonas stutzeri TaxID=316 RepID=UPI001C2EF83C|nr:aldose 1-epimerase [Stutzerimonas stutzeri]